MGKTSLLFIILFSILGSCVFQSKKYFFATSDQSSTYYLVGKELSVFLNSEFDWKLQVLKGEEFNSINNCRKLLSGEVDFAFAQNDISINDILDNDTIYTVSEIRTVIPVYSELVFIVYPDSLPEPENLENLLYDRNVGIGMRGSGSAYLLLELFENFGIDTTRFHLVYCDSDENRLDNPNIEISCLLTGPNNPKIEEMIMRQNGKLFSLGDINLINIASSVDGFCLNYPRARPFIIPKNSYNNKPDKPIVTIAIDAVLLTRASVNERHIYEMLEAIFNNVQSLGNRDWLLFMLNENFDRSHMNFPLHKGTVNYLDRNQPSFFERYAELAGVIFSIMIVIFGAIASLNQRIKRKRKDRIDIYIQKALDIENKIGFDEHVINPIDLISKLNELKRNAYVQLINEKFSANESFNIFINLVNEIIKKVQVKSNSQDQVK